MTRDEAYQYGKDSVRFIACHNVPKLGETYRTDSMGKVTCDAENIREVHQDFCFTAEMNSRDFSPFEFTAHAFNESEISEELWEAYDQGVSDEIFEQLSSYTDADYGIETEA